jgi:hypothetical protein
MVRSAPLPLTPKAAGLASAVAWLRDRGVPTKRIAGLLGITETHTRQLAYRGQWRVRGNSPPIDLFGPISDELRDSLKIRTQSESWMVKLNPAGRAQVKDLEERVEQFGAGFLSSVRYGAGITQLREFLIETGRPAHYRRIRLLARVRQLLAETYVHAGYSASAIEQARTSLLLSKVAYDEKQEPHDLQQLAKTALIASQSHLLRYEPKQSAHYLDIHRDAAAQIAQHPGAEYFRQRGVVAFQSGKAADNTALQNFALAMTMLAETVESGRTKERFEVLNIGTRQMNLVGKINWDGAQELLDYMVTTLPAGEIQIPMNVNWAAACGLSTDSPAANAASSELLDRYRQSSVGFGHQATVMWLLSLSPALPAQLRAAWVRRALYENTFKDY